MRYLARVHAAVRVIVENAFSRCKICWKLTVKYGIGRKYDDIHIRNCFALTNMHPMHMFPLRASYL